MFSYMKPYAGQDTRGSGTNKKLTRAQRADCRAQTRLGASMSSLARLYGCTLPVIGRAVANNFKFKDNLDSDEDYMDNASSARSALQGAPETAAASSDAHTRTPKEPASPHSSLSSLSSLSSAGTAGRVASVDQEKSLPRGYLQGRRKVFSSTSKSIKSESEATVTVPTPLSAVTKQKRKLYVELGMSGSNSNTPAKVARTERLDFEHFQPTKTSSGSYKSSVATLARAPLPSDTQRDYSSRPIHPNSSSGTSQHQSAATTSSRETRRRSPEIIEILSDNESVSPTSRPVDQAPTASTLASTAASTTPAKSPAAPSGNAVVTSFLCSQGRDLSRLLPTFIELGIKGEDGIALLRSMSRSENERWFDKLVIQGKLTPLEAHALLCMLHG